MIEGNFSIEGFLGNSRIAIHRVFWFHLYLEIRRIKGKGGSTAVQVSAVFMNGSCNVRLQINDWIGGVHGQRHVGFAVVSERSGFVFTAFFENERKE